MKNSKSAEGDDVGCIGIFFLIGRVDPLQEKVDIASICT